MTATHRHLRIALACLALLAVTILCGPALAGDLPTGGSVAAGSATIGAATGSSLTITQSSPSAVINWQSFSVGGGYSVVFVQPSSSSATLNRVTGSTTSVIAGTISANGQVYLINPNGIVITSTGTIKAGAFVASTLDISDEDFMAGKRTFTGNGASASVLNQGVITIGRGGYVALLGGSVDNAGTIVVPLGKVGLGSGEQATLDLSGDGFLQVTIPTEAEGTDALVGNSGLIQADGGLVQLSAAAAREMARQAINMSGVIEAKSVSGTNGDIVLAGSDGAVEISGTLDATSADATGGAITVTGRDIALTGASLDVSGLTGGGTVKIGGDKQGSGTLQHADTVTVDAASTIKADATGSGDGGQVVLWSDEQTTFAGTISAKGGKVSGDGGQAEVSGKAKLAYTGFTDLSAAHGSFGTLLLDPYNITIASSGSSGFTATGDDSVISAATLLTALSSADVVISTGSGGSQDGDITVATALSWNSGTTLTLAAAGSIAINAGISIGGSGGLVLTYGSDLSFGSGGSVTYTKADGSAATSSQGGTLSINGTSYTLLYSMADIDAIDSTGLSGAYALARSLDASGTTYTDALVGVDDTAAFTGTFEGLGQTITGLTIVKSGDYAGLFGYVDTGGVVRDIGLVGGSVSGTALVGSLVGYNYGTISNAYSSSTVSGSNGVGGLVGENDATLTNSYATGDVSGSYYVGGLAGISYGTLSDSYATGSVTGTATVGGLAGSISGTVNNVYATGSVTATATNSYVGGLAGNSTATLTNAYATGAVRGVNYVGGLIGYVFSSHTVSYTFATGAVIGTKYVGGLVGQNAGTISHSYSIGAVSGTTFVGGLVGSNPGTITYSYWDTETSGRSSSAGGTGLTTAKLQDGSTASGLGSNFTLTSGLFPYLTSLFPDGVQAISGIAYQDVGSTVAASGTNGAVTVTALSAGTLLGTATTGANGYYYILMPAGTFSSGDSLLTYTTANATTGAANAATYGIATSAALQDGFNLYGSMLMLRTTSTTLSGAGDLTSLQTEALTAAGSDTAAATAINATTGTGYVAPNDFTIDTSVTSSAALVFATTSGNDLTVDAPITLGAGGELWLLAGGALTINALIYAQDTNSVSLGYSTGYTYGSSGRLTYSSRSSKLTINGTSYTLLYSLAEIEAIDTTGLSGHYALATSLDATGTTYTGALVSGTFTGVFEGQNNIITGLTIVSSNDSVGLFDTIGSTGIARNLGLSGGSVTTTGYSCAGILAGVNSGTITNVFATGSVYAPNAFAGGLVGENDGTISNAYAIVAVHSVDGVGGLVGINTGTISNAYAAGAVSGSSSMGGLVGYNYGTISNSYWDTQTSGQSSGIGDDENSQTVTGLTTAQLQNGSSASGLGSSFTLSSGLYPYLSSFYPDGVQAISGTVYTDAGISGAASGADGAVTVTALLGGTLLGTATTGANGYYYILTAAGTFSSGDSLLAYTTANAATGATNSVTYGAATSAASQSDFNLYGNMLTLRTAAAALSTAPVLTSLQASAITAAGSDTAAQAAINATTERGLIATSAFTIDQTTNVSSLLFIATTSGTSLTVADAITVQNGASIDLLSGGALNINAAITVLGAGAVTLTYDASATTNLSFGSGGSLTYAKADGSAANASQGGTLSINGDAYTLLYSMAEVAGLPASTIASLGISGYQGDYALATSLDASGTTYSDALIGASSTLYGGGDYHPFVGVFEGLGHTITGLTITKTSSGYAGMFGAIGGGGVVRDITLANISVTSAGGGTSYVGGLVGFNSGILANVTITGTVSGLYIVGGLVGDNEGGTVVNARVGMDVDGTSSTGGGVGGLAGFNSGTISNSYSTGTVTGTSSTAYMGGLVGENYLHGVITNSYATGAVIGGSVVGGLVGMSHGAVQYSYSTGAVAGVDYVGGLIGYNDDFDLGGTGSTLVGSYWNTETSGTTSATGHGSNSGATGLTTAQLQDGSSASGLGSAYTLTSGLYPYVTSLFPNGVQAVSGYAYKDNGATLLTSGSSGAGVVYVNRSDGTALTVSTGANGYYYAFFASGSSGSSVLAYTVADAGTGAANAATYISSATASLAGFNIYGGRLTETADNSITTLSALDAGYTSAVSDTPLAGLNLANRTVTALATDFTIDDTLSVSGTLMVAVPGNLIIAAGGSVSGADVSLQATGAFINYAGSNAVTADNRWLIYSADSDGDTFGGLDSDNTAIWDTAAGGAVSASGNRYVFAATPTVTVTAINATKTYGVDGTTDPTLYYSISGAATGVDGAYLGDSSILSGAVEVSSAGLAATADVGTYGITLDLGTLTATGATINLASSTGTLTVTQRLITVTANSVTSWWGFTPSLTYTVGGAGLANGDTLSGSLATTATSSSPLGTYAVTQGTLAASSNYSMTFVSGLITVAHPTVNTTEIASMVMRNWRAITAPALLGTPTETLDVASGSSGSWDGMVFSSSRFSNMAFDRGVGSSILTPSTPVQ